jgi:hypothetical protein
MKKITFLMLFSIWASMTFSQNYFPLIEENRTWNVISVILVGPYPWDTTYSTLTYEFSGDTTIDSQTYLKLYESEEENPVNWNLCCYMREENKKVWLKSDPESPEILMYDFNANQGDTLMIGLQAPLEPLVVDSIGVTEIDGTNRIKYYLSYYEYTETWIDGIGSSKGICWSGSSTIVGGWYRFLCMSENGELVYRNPNYESCYLITIIKNTDEPIIKIYPNPAQNLLRIENIMNIEIKSISLTNTAGQIIKQFDSGETQLDVTNINSGLYFLKIAYKKGVLVEKIMIE